jgi:apolipoprotein N-acyltransferase
MNKMKKIYPYAWLMTGFVCLLFFNGRWIIPIAAFIAPIFIIRFFRFQKPFKGFVWIVIAGWISNIIIWKGIIPQSGLFYYFLMFMISVFTSLTYLFDRIYTQKFKGIISTLVFPSAYVIMEFIVISTNPSGSYGTLAHTQKALPLLQIISITGIWGLVFIITWISSVVNWLWDHSFQINKVKLGLLAWGIPFLSVILFGQIRLSLNTENKTVRIASIIISKEALKNRYIVKGHSSIKESNDDFLSGCNIAASSGAKIVFGSETIISLDEERESEYTEKAKDLAQKQNIYLGLPMEVIPNGSSGMLPENKITWISPRGQVLFTYFKARPTPGEGNYGDEIIKYFDSPYGRISSAICFDMDFPTLISQLRNMNIDIMLVPGNDWFEITPYHTYVAATRAIEQGFNLVRAASQGLSASFDHKGQILSSLDYFKTDEIILYSDVPIEGQSTIYSLLGDYFAWLCILFFITISIVLLKRNWIK